MLVMLGHELIIFCQASWKVFLFGLDQMVDSERSEKLIRIQHYKCLENTLVGEMLGPIIQKRCLFLTCLGTDFVPACQLQLPGGYLSICYL